MGEVRTKEQFAKYDEALTTTLRRLIGSSVVVGPVSRSRRHEGPSRMAVSRRSGKSRPPRWAARLQARVGSGSASPPPARADEPGQHTVSSASLAWRALCLLADVPMLPGWDAAGRAIGPNFGGTLGRCRSVLGARPKRRPLVCPGLVRLVAL